METVGHRDGRKAAETAVATSTATTAPTARRQNHDGDQGAVPCGTGEGTAAERSANAATKSETAARQAEHVAERRSTLLNIATTLYERAAAAMHPRLGSTSAQHSTS